MRTLKTKILISMLAVSFTAIVTVSSLTMADAKRILYKKTIENFRSIAKELSYNATRMLEEGRREAGTVAASLVPSSYLDNADALKNELLKLRTALALYEDITVINTAGNVNASTDFKYRGSWKDKESFKQAVAGNISVSKIYAIPSPTRQVVSFTAPIRNASGQVAAVVAIQRNISDIQDVVKHVRIGQTGYAMIFDEENRIIAGSDEKSILSLFFYNKQKLSDRSGQIEYRNEAGRKMIGVCSGDKWVVAIVQEASEVYRPLLRMTFEIAVSSIVLFLIIVLVAFRVSYGITKPLDVLKVAVTRFRRGDFSHRAHVHSSDETGQFADAFNEMLEQIQKRDNAIMQTNIQLEQRVAERTADLEQTVNKLNEANDELESFVNIASHDLREPLRKIISFASILKKSLQGKISSDDAENLAFVIEGTNRMTQIVGGLLAYLRIIVKTQSAENVDINKIAARLEQFELGVLLKEKNATIEIPSSLPVVKADPAQIRQLFLHLIVNGIKYQKKDSIPKITITSKPAAGGMVRIEVTDNGIGIKPEYHQAIFNMFKQLHSHGEYEGAGVGLTVCKKIVELHGGKIGVESQTDKGSTFWFTMPAAEKLTIAATEVESHV